ncbi:MAG: hypothetical protein KA371_13920 [Acidobacteria bacterium]|nr:hypothetical protein [Acidobacteriota bacterium]
MLDPRDTSRDRDGETRDRAYEGRERSDDPRNALLHDLDLPHGREREVVLDRDRVYELNGDDSRTLATVGAFRVVPERDLAEPRDASRDWEDTLAHLHEHGLVHTVALGDHVQGLTLTERGLDLLEANRRSGAGDGQAFHAGVGKARELHHDSHLFAAYRLTEARLREQHDGAAEVRRVVLEEDLKREYQSFLQDHNRDRPESDGRPDRDQDEIRAWALQRDLPYFDDQVHFPDFRVEYEVDGRERHEDVELLTPHYRGAHAASRAASGFRCFRIGGAGGGRGGSRHLRLAEELLA